MRWYADNSELNGIKGAEISDILLFGGLIVSPDAERHIKAEVDKIKRRHSGESLTPIKWNLKDLRNHYKRQNKISSYDELLSTSPAWRNDIFECLAATDCVLLVSLIEGYSPKRTVLKDQKDGLTRFIFSNALMRYGLYVRDKKPQGAHVILDWPYESKPTPFDSEYACAYALGQTADGRVPYHCGKLRDLGFGDSVLFTNMRHSTLLQVADLVVGATREFVMCCLGKKQSGPGLDCLQLVRDKFRGAPDNILGYGLIIPTGNAKLLASVKKGINELLYTISSR